MLNMQTLDSGQPRRLIEGEWELVKRSFRDTAAGPWLIELPQNLHKGKLPLWKEEEFDTLKLERFGHLSLWPLIVNTK
jgi:hypothetical protein